MVETRKQTILIADDSALNRALLRDMLEDMYDIYETTNGEDTVALLRDRNVEIDLILLDVVMPRMDGFQVLELMNSLGWIEDVPVIMISADDSLENMERAYSLGVTDFITHPFVVSVVHHRVDNTILLYAKQKRLIGMVADQIYEKEKQSQLMINILSHIVEFRNGESGKHVQHIHVLTELFLHHLLRITDVYPLSAQDVAQISLASSLHDIGKIAIPEQILNKPGKLTPEEFAIMKTHAEIGSEMIKRVPYHQSEPLVRLAYTICRWHHERWDGRGYPDGLKGDAIPIEAQVVSLVDVYDALTSDRVYKAAYSHEEAVRMILQGECGVFNPLLLDCLREIADRLPGELEAVERNDGDERRKLTITGEVFNHEQLTLSERTIQMLEQERRKVRFFTTVSGEILFEYIHSPAMIALSPRAMERLGLPKTFLEPENNPQFLQMLGEDNLAQLSDALRNTTPDQPMVQMDFPVHVDGKTLHMRMIAQVAWMRENPPRYVGAVGKCIDLATSQWQSNDMEWMTNHDLLTRLPTFPTARERMVHLLGENPEALYALVLVDVDHMQSANERHGHLFGDRMLAGLAEKLRQTMRQGDLLARSGGDEFLIFFQFSVRCEDVVERLYRVLSGEFDSYPLSVSMGVAQNHGKRISCNNLLSQARQALLQAKDQGGGRICYAENAQKQLPAE